MSQESHIVAVKNPDWAKNIPDFSLCALRQSASGNRAEVIHLQLWTKLVFGTVEHKSVSRVRASRHTAKKRTDTKILWTELRGGGGGIGETTQSYNYRIICRIPIQTNWRVNFRFRVGAPARGRADFVLPHFLPCPPASTSARHASNRFEFIARHSRWVVFRRGEHSRENVDKIFRFFAAQLPLVVAKHMCCIAVVQRNSWFYWILLRAWNV